MESCRNCPRWKEAKERIRVLEALEKTISKIDERIATNDFQPSFGEYLKLMQMEKEYVEKEEGIREIKVTWVEPETAQKQ